MSDSNTLTIPVLSELLEALGAPPDSGTQELVDVIAFPYQGRLRRYHDVDHFDDMSEGEMPEALQIRLVSSFLGINNEEAEALLSEGVTDPQAADAQEVLKTAKARMRFAGYLHDCAYKQIDGAEDEKTCYVWPLSQRQIGNYTPFN